MKRLVTLEGKLPWQLILDQVNADKDRQASEQQAERDRQATIRQAEADRQAAERQAERDRQAAERQALIEADVERARTSAMLTKAEIAKETALKTQAMAIIEQKRQEQVLKELLAEKARLLEKEEKINRARQILNQPVLDEELEGMKSLFKKSLPIRSKTIKSSPFKTMSPLGVPKSTFAKTHQPRTKKGKKTKRAQETGIAKGVGAVGLGIGAVFGAPLLASGIASIGASLVSSGASGIGALGGIKGLSQSFLGQSGILSPGSINSGSDFGGQNMLETLADPSISEIDNAENYVDVYSEQEIMGILGASAQSRPKKKQQTTIKRKDKKTGQVIQKKTIQTVQARPQQQKPKKMIVRKGLNQSRQNYPSPAKTTNFPVRSMSYTNEPYIEEIENIPMEQEYFDTSKEIPFVEDYDYSPFEDEMEADLENYTGLEE